MRYCDGKKTHFGYDFSGSSHMAELRLLLGRTCLIRRLKSEVLAELPAKQRQMVILDPAAVKSKSKEMKASSACNRNRHGLSCRAIHYRTESGTYPIQR